MQAYCLDANILIKAWEGYYSPTICPTYWTVLNDLGKSGIIFVPEAVFDEIAKTEDDLSKWLKKSQIKVHKQDGRIGEALNKIYAANPNHKYLVDSKKGRSLADPWVIAHALTVGACVVTKEQKILTGGPDKIKIPNVCHNMGIKCIDDFAFLKEVRVEFVCKSIM